MPKNLAALQAATGRVRMAALMRGAKGRRRGTQMPPVRTVKGERTDKLKFRREQRSSREENRAQSSQNCSRPESHGTISPAPDGIAPLKKPTSPGFLGKIKDVFRRRS